MDTTPKRPRGRPRSAAPLSAAERMRRYRARLRARGVRRVESHRRDALLAGFRVPERSLLTPGEQEVLRRFCAGLSRLPRLPRHVALFGSRARGDADASSDLDVAVRFLGAPDASVETALATLALTARRPYCHGNYGIFLKPLALFAGERGAGALEQAIAREGYVVWTRPR